ncbi:MAG TPA: hypothetical protein VIH72_14935 [Candidatus Acidoferrales bacterium]|jgi:hypothetical protein
MKKKLHRATILFLVAVVASGCGRSTPTLSPAQTGVSPEQQSADAAGFKEFSNRVDNYVKLHKSQEVLLPALKPTVSPEAINAHQRALSLKIREARPNAKLGDIFTPAAQKSFQDVIQSAMQGPRGANMDATLKQGAPLPQINVAINQPYPDGVPFTTVPPTLLQLVPKLPDEVVYRVVLHDLLLMDVKANLVVDVIPGIIP